MSVTATTRSRIEDGTLPARFTPHALAARLAPVPGAAALLQAALGDAGQCAALWILTGLRRDDARIWSHADGGRIDFAAILREPRWTRAERAALCAAWSLRVGNVEASLAELAELLDDELWHALLEALRIRRADWVGGAW
jgi:hypothetical protein